MIPGTTGDQKRRGSGRKPRRQFGAGFRRWLAATQDLAGARAGVLIVVLALIALHGLAPKSFVVDSTSVALVVIGVVVVLVPLLDEAQLPFGGGLKFRRQTEHARALVDELSGERPIAPIASSPPLTDTTLERVADLRLTAALGMAPLISPWNLDDDPESERIVDPSDHDPGEAEETREPPYVFARRFLNRQSTDPVEIRARVLRASEAQPRAGFALISREVSRLMRRILAATGWGAGVSQESIRDGLRRLVELDQLPQSAAGATDAFARVREALRDDATRPTDAEIREAVDVGLRLYEALSAIPRQRNVVAAVNVQLYADSLAQEPVRDATGLLLETTTPAGEERSNQIFPTTHDYFRVGEEVAWGWNLGRIWGEAWFVHAETGEITHAWTQSAEFIGPMLDDIP